jgi:hypothetical protein
MLYRFWLSRPLVPGYGGYEAATLLSYYTTTYVTTCYYTGTSKYYTEKAEYYTRTYATPGPVYYTEEPKHYSPPRYHQIEAPVNYTTNASELLHWSFEVQHHQCTTNLQERVNMLFYIV